MFGLTLPELLVTVLVVGALLWLLVAAIASRPQNQTNEADLYIARLNEAAAQQQRQETERADKIRQATMARTAAAARTSTGRNGQGAASSASRAATARGSAQASGDPEYLETVQLIRAGKTLEAIRKVRRDTGISVAEATKFVNSLRAS
jgi:ribosomal protein L7/L12